MNFRKTFQHYGTQGRNQDKFLSRLFGIFSERIVSIWGNHEKCPYLNLGRPHVQTIQEAQKNQRGNVFDFTFKDKQTSQLFVVEQKCELEFENYKFLELNDPKQLKHHQNADTIKRKRGFSRFLDITNNPNNYSIKVDGNEVKIDGIILIWGTASEKGKNLVKKQCNVHDILSLEEIINELIAWNSHEYFDMIDELQQWSNNFYDDLKHN